MPNKRILIYNAEFTERERGAEEALRESEEWFRITLEEAFWTRYSSLMIKAH